jgi:hypothetical protein
MSWKVFIHNLIYSFNQLKQRQWARMTSENDIRPNGQDISYVLRNPSVHHRPSLDPICIELHSAHRCNLHFFKINLIVLWRDCPKKELLRHGNLETRIQQ